MTTKPRREYPLGGWILLAVGTFLLLGQMFPQSDDLLLVLLAAGFVGAALLTHTVGLLVPGGLLAGVALGIYLVDPMRSSAPDSTQGGVFLMAIAAGWALITLLSPLLGRWVWWPLIPAALLGFIGWAVWDNRPELLEQLNLVWPLALVGVGVWILLRPPRAGKPS